MRKVIAAVTLGVLLCVASAQEIRAWQTLNFADPPEVVQEKMVALQDEGVIVPPRDGIRGSYRQTSRFPENSSYPMSLAGVDMRLSFDFNDAKLYRLTFLGDRLGASQWHSTMLPSVATLREVLESGLGPPTNSWNVDFLDLRPGFIQWFAMWRSGGVTRYLGVQETRYNYYPVIRIQWDWMVDLIAGHEESQRDSDIEDAADGF